MTVPGRSRPAARRARHRLEWAALWAMRGLARLPGDLVGRLGAALGSLAWRRGLRRDVVVSQLRASFPDRDPAWVRRTARSSYRHMGRVLLAAVATRDAGAAPHRVESTGLAPLLEATEHGGAVLVTGHLGNWELLGAAVARAGIAVDLVGKPMSNPWVNGMVRESRRRRGIGVLEWRPGADTAGRALRAIEAGRVVGFAADQEARDAGIFVPFFGRPASTHRGPALLAIRSGAPLFVGAALRTEDGGYRCFARRIDTSRDGPPAEAVRRLTAAMTAEIQRLVEGAPDQYFWHHRRWKTAPGGAAARNRAAGGLYNTSGAGSRPSTRIDRGTA